MGLHQVSPCLVIFLGFSAGISQGKPLWVHWLCKLFRLCEISEKWSLMVPRSFYISDILSESWHKNSNYDQLVYYDTHVLPVFDVLPVQ